VVATRVGYAGGNTSDPTYTSIGDHTESIQVMFCPSKITYTDLVEVFWTSHNPTQPTFSKQYACYIFSHNPHQHDLAIASLNEQQKHCQKKITTTIKHFTGFTDAEGYHQKYMLSNNLGMMDFFHYDSDSEDFKSSFVACKLNAYLAGHLSKVDFLDHVYEFGISSKMMALLQRRMG